MPSYQYKAIDVSGKKVSGHIDADSVKAARNQLRLKNIFATEVIESVVLENKKNDVLASFKKDKVSGLQLAISTRQLATLITAGMPLVSALRVLSEQTENLIFKKILVDVREKVEQGSSFAKALAVYPRVFPKLFISMVESSEAAGNLSTVLLNLANYLEEQLELKRKVTSALIYPIIMLVISALIIGLMFVFVIPNIVDMFKKQGATLPLPTQILILISETIISYWWLIAIAVIALNLLYKWYYKTSAGRKKIDTIRLALPLIGPTYIKISSARVSQTLSALLSSGVQLLPAIDICKKIVDNVIIEHALDEIKDGVREGRSLAKEMQKTKVFPVMLSQMIAVGEQSGDLEGMLLNIGNAYKKEVDATLNALTSIINPILLLVVGGIVGAMVFSIMLPMLDLLDAVHQ